MAKPIDYYFFPLSPFAYLTGDKLETEAPGSINYYPVDMGRIFPATGGVPLAQRPEQRQKYRLIELQRISKRAGLPLNLHPKYFPANTRPACCLLIAARETGADVGKLTKAILRGVWAEERNIADLDDLRAITESCGLPTELVDQIDQYEDLLDQQSDEAVERGVFGSPFYLVEGEPFWGQDRLDEALEAARD